MEVAEDPPPRPRKNLFDLQEDCLLSVLSNLECSEILPAVVSHKAQQLVRNPKLWASVSCNYSAALFDKISRFNSHNGSSPTEIYGMEICRKLEAASCAQLLDWEQGEYHLTSTPLESQEAHAATSVLDRYIVVVGGWGPNTAPGISVVDGRSLPGPLVTIPCNNTSVGRFRYGMTVVADVNHVETKRRLFIFGGLTVGGYGGDCNDLYSVALKFNTAGPASEEITDSRELATLPVGGIASINAAHRRVLPLSAPAASTRGFVPSTRGYHSANILRLGGRESMIVFGGLHNRGPCTKLEVYDIEANSWRQGDARGREPAPRFGHTSVIVYRNTLAKPELPLRQLVDNEASIDVIITGGSDGSDLIRNGRELRNIFVLAIENNGETYTMNWSCPQLSSLGGGNIVPGRCHSASLVGSNIIYFGGGAVNSAKISVLQLVPPSSAPATGLETFQSPPVAATASGAKEEEGGKKASSAAAQVPASLGSPGRSYVMFRPRIDRRGQGRACPRPRRRLSHIAVASGQFIFMHGGFSNRFRELGDYWALDVGRATSDCRPRLVREATERAKRTSSRAAISAGAAGATSDGDADESVELNSDEEKRPDDDDDDDDDYDDYDDEDEDEDEDADEDDGGGGGFEHAIQLLLQQGVSQQVRKGTKLTRGILMLFNPFSPSPPLSPSPSLSLSISGHRHDAGQWRYGNER